MLLLINVILTLWVSCANGQEVKPCDFPEIQHGGLYYKSLRRLYFPAAAGQSYSYYCDQNFVTPSGSYWDYIHCTQDGWSPTVPCLRTCSKSDVEIENGFISESSSIYILNEETQYNCKPGYATADGNSSGSITCLQNGWSTQPICIKFCDMPVFENSRAKSNGMWFKLHDTLDYECYDGYESSYGNTTDSIVCGEDGWSHLPTCYNSSENCGPPPPISNGDTTSFPQKVYLPWSRVEYQCQSYYELQGSKYVTCSNGDWSEPPRCISMKPCEFPEIQHGHLYYENTRRPYFPVATGQSYSYYCDQNFVTPSGSYWDYIHCTQDGWLPTVPCLRTCSKSDIEIENGFISESSSIYILNKEIQYKCKPGYATADGNSSGSITCLQNGWSAQPICINSSEKCGPPPPISNGDTTSFLLKVYVPQSRVEYQCQSYYELQGSNYVTCSNGEWSEPPRCIHPCIITEENMNKNNIQLKGKSDIKYYAKTGDTIEFMCKLGYNANTSVLSFQAVCREGIVEYPRCE
ncbi:complement factor H-related protein 4 isoform X2 [Homo sapiens]|uniref:complement factor H-related protein 4 isoform X2 n=1 Tax=Homo sapiens TaxID=9606 RepID=UPI0023DFD55B|nr:complement factor H-related protein 4 isoform X2 [Homo sapiens]XP_054189917.1 complement factor H-related protein 4 isoform X2 [Homo sapiens]